jgi:hypothetical protein
LKYDGWRTSKVVPVWDIDRRLDERATLQPMIVSARHRFCFLRAPRQLLDEGVHAIDIERVCCGQLPQEGAGRFA